MREEKKNFPTTFSHLFKYRVICKNKKRVVRTANDRIEKCAMEIN